MQNLGSLVAFHNKLNVSFVGFSDIVITGSYHSYRKETGVTLRCVVIL